MSRLRGAEIVTAILLLAMIALWIAGGIGWTHYTPTSTRVTNVPTWQAAVILFALLVFLITVDVRRSKPR